jgi:hypothetical protein
MSEALRPATHARHYVEPPQKTEADGTRHWITRAANFVTVVSQASNDAVLERDNPDEYMVLMPSGTEAVIEADGERIESKGDSLIIVPPGESRVRVRKAGVVVRVFSNKASDLTAAAKTLRSTPMVRPKSRRSPPGRTPSEDFVCAITP